MGMNDAHLYLMAPGSKVVREIDPFSQPSDGQAREIIDIKPGVLNEKEAIKADQFCAWLESLGYSVLDWGGYRNGDIRVSVYTDDTPYVSSITLTLLFELNVQTRRMINARSRRIIWREFACELGQRWGLQFLSVPAGESMAETFDRELEETFAWECYLLREQSAGWSTD